MRVHLRKRAPPPFWNQLSPVPEGGFEAYDRASQTPPAFRYPEKSQFDTPTPDYPMDDRSPGAKKTAPPIFKFPTSYKDLSIPSPCIDPYVNSSKVYGLNACNFGSFLSEKDVSLVFFYGSRDQEDDKARDEFKQAAGCTKRSNHAFAAVNCGKERALCKMLSVANYPTFRLYSGEMITQNVRGNNKTADELRAMVENNTMLLRPIKRSR